MTQASEGETELTNKERRLLRKEQKAREAAEAAAAAGTEQIEVAPSPGKKEKLSKKDKSSKKRAREDLSAADKPASPNAEEAAVADALPREAEAELGEDGEPISHKERRKRRRLEKAAASRGEDPSTAIAAKKTRQAPEPPKRSPHSLWIGNMCFQTSPQRIEEWLKENGLKEITRVHMPKGEKRADYNRGFAYIDVVDAEDVAAGVALSESHLDGRRLLIKSGGDYRGRPGIDATSAALAIAGTAGAATVINKRRAGAHSDDEDDEKEGPVPRKGRTGLTKTAQKILRAQKNPAGPTLFVGNLSFASTEEGLREMFERNAKLRDEREKEWAPERAKLERREKRREERRQKAREEGRTKEEADAESSEGSDDDEENVDKEEDAADSDAATSADEADSNSEEKPSSKVVEKGRTAKPAKNSSGVRGTGIRKIRMGTFEDTGKCKGFAFVDFHTSAHATASLIDIRNTFLDGRTLILQYAGADAVRRGAVKGTAAAAGGPARTGRSEFGFAPRGPPRGSRADNSRVPWEKREQQQQRDAEADSVSAPVPFVPTGPAPEPGSFDPSAPLVRKHKETQEERRARRAAEAAAGAPARHEKRPKPGAALANAQREKVGIVQSAGTKVTFD